MKKKKNFYFILSIGLLLSALIFLFIDNFSPPPITKEVGGERSVVGLVTLLVGEDRYENQIREGDTVYDLMKNLENNKEKNFTFKAKEYPSLGYFIDEINGVRGQMNSYWIYYINGEESSVGVSWYVLKDGDIINWKQE